uniref:Uncharacterized protein n=1 Tax=Bionectria ochroleuca TaxID=29856 RepID=A0A0B7KAU1_BIOOC
MMAQVSHHRVLPKRYPPPTMGAVQCSDVDRRYDNEENNHAEEGNVRTQATGIGRILARRE